MDIAGTVFLAIVYADKSSHILFLICPDGSKNLLKDYRHSDYKQTYLSFLLLLYALEDDQSFLQYSYKS